MTQDNSGAAKKKINIRGSIFFFAAKLAEKTRMWKYRDKLVWRIHAHTGDTFTLPILDGKRKRIR